MSRRLAAVVLVAGVMASASVMGAATTLPEPIAKVMKAERLPADSLSVVVATAGKAEPELTYNAGQARNPASVMKLVTTWAGLNLLGPGHRWRTRVHVGETDVVRDDGRLAGNLYLEGGGDPFLVTDQIRTLLRMVRRYGIKRIDGDLVLDDSYFALGAHNPGAFDGKPHRAYNVGPDAVLLNFRANQIEMVLDPAKTAVRVHLLPPLPGIALDNAIQIRKSRCRGRPKVSLTMLDPGAPSARLSGVFPTGCERYTLLRVVAGREAYARTLLGGLWREVGGELKGKVRFGRMPKATREVARLSSEPLSRLLWSMNKFSNNVMTRQLLLTIGAEVGQAPGTLRKGRAAISRWLSSRKIPIDGMVIDNGAGLSRRARLSANTVVALLRDIYASPWRSELVSTLPLPGIDGSMRRRHRKGALAGRGHLKTGLLNSVRSVAGFVHPPGHPDMMVVVLHNHPGIQQGAGTRVQDAVLDWIVTHFARP